MAIADLQAVVQGEPNGALVLALHGELDTATGNTVTNWMASLPAEPGYVIDLSDISFVDSDGLRSLLKARQLADATAAGFALRAPTRQAMDLLELTGLDVQFTIID